MVCPVSALWGNSTKVTTDRQARSAYDLKKAWGEGLVLKMVDDAGHSAKEAGIRKLLVEVSPLASVENDNLTSRLPQNSLAYNSRHA
jgi:hypothetical protein